MIDLTILPQFACPMNMRHVFVRFTKAGKADKRGKIVKCMWCRRDQGPEVKRMADGMTALGIKFDYDLA